MSNINSNEMYALLRDVSSGSLTIDDAMTRIKDMKKSDMQYDPPETPIQETEVTALIQQENNMTPDENTEITSKTYIDEVVKADEVPTPDPEVTESDEKRDEKVENPEDGPKEREPEEKAEEKPAYVQEDAPKSNKNKRTERKAESK